MRDVQSTRLQDEGRNQMEEFDLYFMLTLITGKNRKLQAPEWHIVFGFDPTKGRLKFPVSKDH